MTQGRTDRTDAGDDGRAADEATSGRDAANTGASTGSGDTATTGGAQAAEAATPDGGRGRPSAYASGHDRGVGEAPVLPDRAAEDRPEAWGERPDEDDDERYLRERPPHW